MDSRRIAMEYRFSQWAQALNERIASGESIDEFCRGRGVSRNTFFYGQRKIREAACGRLADAQNQTALPAPGFVEARLAQPEAPGPTAAGCVRIEIGGYKVTAGGTYPTGALATLLRELANPC